MSLSYLYCTMNIPLKLVVDNNGIGGIESWFWSSSLSWLSSFGDADSVHHFPLVACWSRKSRKTLYSYWPFRHSYWPFRQSWSIIIFSQLPLLGEYKNLQDLPADIQIHFDVQKIRGSWEKQDNLYVHEMKRRTSVIGHSLLCFVFHAISVTMNCISDCRSGP